jgi:hypothetical protein
MSESLDEKSSKIIAEIIYLKIYSGIYLNNGLGRLNVSAQLPGSPAPAKCGFGRVEKLVMERLW